MPGSVTFFYDGSCGLCHRLVRFLAAIDRRAVIRFAPLGGQTFLRIDQRRRDSLPDAAVVLTPRGRLLGRSAALRASLFAVGGPWTLPALILLLMPTALADAIYDAVAQTRRRWFQAPESECPLVPVKLRGRFLP